MKRRVLVVDDDRALAQTLADILELHGWRAACAHTGEEALQYVADEAPDAVVMDIRMPGIGGVDALRRMKASRPLMKVLLMTAYAARELLDDAVNAGAIHILQKPVKPEALLETLGEGGAPQRPVLVVDDDVLFLESLSALLEMHYVDVVRARSLGEALMQLTETNPRVVLLDMRLDPALEPTECVAAIREASPEVVFILYSGFPRLLEETRDRLPEEWVQGCLHKPFPPMRLLELLA